MRFIPSRPERAGLIERTQDVAPAAACGFVRTIDDDPSRKLRAAVSYSTVNAR